MSEKCPNKNDELFFNESLQEHIFSLAEVTKGGFGPMRCWCRLVVTIGIYMIANYWSKSDAENVI